MDSCMLGEHMLQSLKYAWDYLLRPPFPFHDADPISNVNSNGIVIPFSGCLWFVAVQSRILAKNYIFPLPYTNTEECTSTFANFSLEDIPENFNSLKMTVQLCALLNDPYDTERLQLLPDCTYLTAPQKLVCINFNNPEEIDKCLQTGNQIIFDVPCTQEGYIHLIGTWFQVQLDENVALCSAPSDVNANNCCWDQAIFPCMKSHYVMSDSKVKILGDWSGGKVSFDIKQISHPNGEIINNDAIPMTAPSACISMLNDANLIAHLTKAAIRFIQSYRATDCVRILDLYPVPVFGLTVLGNAHLMHSFSSKLELVSVVNSSEEKNVILKIAESNNIPLSALIFIEEENFEVSITNSSDGWFDAVIVNMIGTEGDLSECWISRINLLK